MNIKLAVTLTIKKGKIGIFQGNTSIYTYRFLMQLCIVNVDN